MKAVLKKPLNIHEARKFNEFDSKFKENSVGLDIALGVCAKDASASGEL